MTLFDFMLNLIVLKLNLSDDLISFLSGLSEMYFKGDRLSIVHERWIEVDGLLKKFMAEQKWSIGQREINVNVQYCNALIFLSDVFRSKLNVDYECKNVIVYIKTSNISEKTLLMDVSKVMSVKKSINLPVVIASNQGCKLYKWVQYDEEHCRGYYKLTDIKNETLFAQQNTYEFFKCPVYITIPHKDEYVPVGKREVDHPEFKMITEVVERYNGRILLLRLPEQQPFWVVSNEIGSMSMLLKGADLVMGGLALGHQRYSLAKPVYPYSRFEYLWYLKKPAPRPQWLRIFTGFSVVIWSLFVLVILILTLFHYTVEVSNSISLSFIITLSIILGISLSTAPRTNTVLRVHSLTSFYALHISTAYESNLISLLTGAENKHDITSLEELIDEGYSFILHFSSEAYLQDLQKHLLDQIYSTERVIHEQNYIKILKILSETKSASLLVNYWVKEGSFIKKDETGNRMVTTIPDPFVTAPVTAFTPYGHNLFDFFNRKFQQYFEAGLIIKYDEKFFGHQNDGSRGSSDPRSLTMNHVEGAFYVLGIGLSLSLISFLVEVIQIKFKRQRSMVKKDEVHSLQ